MFSNSEDYVIEILPKNIGFFKKRKLVREKLNQILEEKAQVWVKDNIILWAFLKEDELFWMPFEKVAFYLSIFKEENSEAVIIMEEEDGITHYFGVVSKFLISYNRDLDEVLCSMKNYGVSKIKFLSIGKVDKKCNKNLKNYQIAELIGYEKKDFHYEEFDEDAVFINESADKYEGFNDHDEKDTPKLNDLFLFWFQKKAKHSFINTLLDFFKSHFKMIFLISGFVFLGLAILLKFRNDALEEKISIAMQRLLKNS